MGAAPDVSRRHKLTFYTPACCLNVSGTRMAAVDMKNLMRPQLYTQNCADQGVLREGEIVFLRKERTHR